MPRPVRASLGSIIGRPEAGVRYAQTAAELANDARYEPFANGLNRFWEANGHLMAGELERTLELVTDLAGQDGPARVYGHCGQTMLLARLGRHNEATAIAEQGLAAARAHGNPFVVALAFLSNGLAYSRSEPARALETFSQGLAWTRKHRLPFHEVNIAREAAPLEAVHGDLDTALSMLDDVINSLQQAGQVTQLALALANLVVIVDRAERAEIAATVYGSTINHPGTKAIFEVARVVDHLRAMLGDETFERFVATGKAMELPGAVRYARNQIQLARQELATPRQADGTR